MNPEDYGKLPRGTRIIPPEPEEETDATEEAIKNVVKEMILSGEIRLQLYQEEAYSNEGFHYGERTQLRLVVDGEPSHYHIVLEDVEITNW